MGFYKSNLLSITDIFRVVDWNFPLFTHNLAWYLFAGFTLVSTVLWGRFYCGRVCAFGALTQLMDAALPAAAGASRCRAALEAAGRHGSSSASSPPCSPTSS